MSQSASRRLDDLLGEAARLLRSVGIDRPRREAELLLTGLTGSRLVEIWAGRPDPLSPEVADLYLDAVGRRAAGLPLEYALGQAEFAGYQYKVGPDVLIPRPETELLLEDACSRFDSVPSGVALDLGTGSGCLLTAYLARRSGWRGVGIDRSPAALDCAKKNAERLGVGDRCNWLLSDWLSAVADHSADLLLANPPYVVPGEPTGPGVAEYEPHLALFTPHDEPMAPYEAILERAWAVLRPGGLLIFETAADRDRQVAACVEQKGELEVISTRNDEAGLGRVVVAQRPD